MWYWKFSLSYHQVKIIAYETVSVSFMFKLQEKTLIWGWQVEAKFQRKYWWCWTRSSLTIASWKLLHQRVKDKVVENIHEQLDLEKSHEKIMEDLIKIKIKAKPITQVAMCPSIRLILLTIVHQLALLELRFSSWLSTIAWFIS